MKTFDETVSAMEDRTANTTVPATRMGRMRAYGRALLDGFYLAILTLDLSPLLRKK